MTSQLDVQNSQRTSIPEMGDEHCMYSQGGTTSSLHKTTKRDARRPGDGGASPPFHCQYAAFVQKMKSFYLLPNQINILFLAVQELSI
jgi:hypothetical protein